jgi:glycogen debranching enzyme
VIITAPRTRIRRSILKSKSNRSFPDAGETPEYNTVDVTLWYFEAVRALLDYTGDYEFVRANLYAALVDIIAWHERGTSAAHASAFVLTLMAYSPQARRARS